MTPTREGNFMADRSVREVFETWLADQAFIPDKPANTAYLTDPQTDEERAVINLIIEEEKREGVNVILMDANEFQATILKRLEQVYEIMEEDLEEYAAKIEAINWPIRRRVTELRPANIIYADDWTNIRKHVSYIECYGRQVKVVFCGGHERWVSADLEVEVFRPGSI
jgi:hypothetical protein